MPERTECGKTLIVDRLTDIVYAQGGRLNARTYKGIKSLTSEDGLEDIRIEFYDGVQLLTQRVRDPATGKVSVKRWSRRLKNYRQAMTTLVQEAQSTLYRHTCERSSRQAQVELPHLT